MDLFATIAQMVERLRHAYNENASGISALAFFILIWNYWGMHLTPPSTDMLLSIFSDAHVQIFSIKDDRPSPHLAAAYIEPLRL